MRIIYITIAILFSLVIKSNAQSNKGEEIKVELSNPGEAGKLFASSHRGSITVEAHSGKNVIITLVVDDEGKKSKSKNGLNRISGGSANAEIIEENNLVRIETGSQTKVDLYIKVPRNFDVNLHTHHNGDIYVKDIDGTSEIDAHHGGVTLEGVGSSANVNTHHGEIKATFRRVDASVPMVLTTYHGDVDISLPAGSSFNTKLKTSKGDIFTDFELSMNSSVNKVEKTGNGTKIEIGGWRHGKIGGGGEEYMLSTYHGDIIIRKND